MGVAPCPRCGGHLTADGYERDRFGVHSLAYYQRAYELFYPRGECELLLAEYERAPLAALMVFARGVQKQRELAVRSALGASAWDTMRSALVESALLTAVSVIAGLVLAARSTAAPAPVRARPPNSRQTASARQASRVRLSARSTGCR